MRPYLDAHIRVGCPRVNQSYISRIINWVLNCVLQQLKDKEGLLEWTLHAEFKLENLIYEN